MRAKYQTLIYVATSEREREREIPRRRTGLYLVWWLRRAVAGRAACPLLGPECRGVDSERWVDGPCWRQMDRALPSKEGQEEKRSADTEVQHWKPLKPRANCSRLSRWNAGIPLLGRLLLLVQARKQPGENKAKAVGRPGVRQSGLQATASPSLGADVEPGSASVWIGVISGQL